ncbi:4Fe-4S binding protein [Selenihalanaerobacter shriftii]|uniref:4Fe-4S binding domain-containing protein n=1 Tax=Selenihalanaerobacter shriftii TaxID=142842 RepID=A0A1T4K384_9FIRM|nr:4Fe-4S binding protein [Selenihalanaerobacter shriftii]SJZ36859.1 4Fe-4S binding domain-containing protein [Selenihalanaerobacter shriftii]
MPVFVNVPGCTCDDLSGCPSIYMCDADALTYDEENDTIVYDEEACWDCQTCVKYCEVNMIYYAETNEELEEIKQILGVT